ncbi:yrdC domain-containing protein, mitochondrial isoform X2 [Thrips palmi]|uniref:Threonylcarbamoyl-AMP synthase n=1 Tax=Thrips palmi TaxID=161013 RepID=A0A6P8YZA6_THRPL|nr:yrdC domain-containing protein, mitochondrial isoform X2 [Thrips palmi]
MNVPTAGVTNIGLSRMAKMRLSTVVPVGESGKAQATAVDMASRLLMEGNIIALPTDTIYGLAACAQNTTAVRKLYGVKGRDSAKPLAMCVGEVEDVRLWSKADILPDGLLKALLPGPVTVILERSPLLNRELNPNCSKVGIRVPDHPFVRKLAQNVSSPLALTSANLSNEPSSLNVREFENLWPQLGAVFDGGSLGNAQSTSSRAGSTVVDLSNEGKYHIVRNGIAPLHTVEILHQFGLEPFCNLQNTTIQ